jgi:hypothetical protein
MFASAQKALREETFAENKEREAFEGTFRGKLVLNRQLTVNTRRFHVKKVLKM